jgi:hypothetical protein
MKTKSENISLLMKPSAWIPLMMSLAALALVLVHAAMFGVVHEADEGTVAHIFQILITLQIPVVIYFAVKYLPKQPRQSLKIFALQAGAWITAIAAVYWLT